MWGLNRFRRCTYGGLEGEVPEFQIWTRDPPRSAVSKRWLPVQRGAPSQNPDWAGAFPQFHRQPVVRQLQPIPPADPQAWRHPSPTTRPTGPPLAPPAPAAAGTPAVAALPPRQPHTPARPPPKAPAPKRVRPRSPSFAEPEGPRRPPAPAPDMVRVVESLQGILRRHTPEEQRELSRMLHQCLTPH